MATVERLLYQNASVGGVSRRYDRCVVGIRGVVGCHHQVQRLDRAKTALYRFGGHTDCAYLPFFLHLKKGCKAVGLLENF